MASPEEKEKLLNNEVFMSRLLSIAIGRLKSLEDARDVLQDTWLDVFKTPDSTMEAVKNLEGWVVTALNNKINGMFQGRSKWKPAPVSEEVMAMQTQPLYPSRLEELEKAVALRLGKVPAIVFNLHFIQDKEYPEIADIIHKKPGNVRKIVCTIRQFIRNTFGNERQ